MLNGPAPAGYTVNGLDNSGASLPYSSLWLTSSAGVDSVIIDPVHFTPGKVVQIHGVPERKLVALGNPIERSEGWMRVAVEPANG